MPDSSSLSCAPLPPVEDVGSRRMTLGEHLEELRARLGLCVLLLLVFLFLGAVFYQQLWVLIRMPLQWAAVYLGRKPEELVSFIWLSPMAGFTAIASVDLIASILLALPVLVYETWCFVAPGLTPRERHLAFSIVTAGSGLFLTGVAVAFVWGAPLALQWLLSFNVSLTGSANQWTLDEYLGFLSMIDFGFGVSFETPLVMLALARAGLIDPACIRRTWRHALFLIVILAAIFTPPDPFSQTILAGLLVFLYFAGYLLVRWIAPKPTAMESH